MSYRCLRLIARMRPSRWCPETVLCTLIVTPLKCVCEPLPTREAAAATQPPFVIDSLCSLVGCVGVGCNSSSPFGGGGGGRFLSTNKTTLGAISQTTSLLFSDDAKRESEQTERQTDSQRRNKERKQAERKRKL
jgi:hypothetical protein